ncbi:Inositolphosphorylceramide synthase subunit Kei1-domain-containing protein [Dioszegia hungarica]|uniref:Inositolphosphorylceramide synthase subunit Kei1-domain-containing protein n=1 Tax=Dioszegia hungarica TaxID=4972 RepID=A0AA38HFY1_9TREE|nr:Inositolphosphorylceramide synthase subunit Kei1-domain-containing protein [Dioszegia hungarica]KAI9639607.1 Inositolphosphorylceramide synthase subunit Kei1-domain-containing protein [Dioszegia hungarica]
MRLSSRAFQPGAILDSFLGILDIKLGCEIVLLFGLINKVAGVYGLITIFVGGSFLQYLFYAYSIGTLFAFLWALNIVKSEKAKPALLVAHLYTLDHLILSIAHYGFYIHYWFVVAHDGRRIINSSAQQALIDLAVSRGETTDPTSGGGAGAGGGDYERKRLAEGIWASERVVALWILAVGWLVKIYFILSLYSYAAHLRSSTYHALPLTSRSKASRIAHPTSQADLEAEVLHDELEEGASDGRPGTKGSALVGEQAVRSGPAEADLDLALQGVGYRKVEKPMKEGEEDDWDMGDDEGKMGDASASGSGSRN